MDRDLLVVGTGNPDGEGTTGWSAALKGNRHRGRFEAVGVGQVEIVCVSRVMSQRPLDLDGRPIRGILMMGETRNSRKIDVLDSCPSPTGHNTAVKHTDAITGKRRSRVQDLLHCRTVVELSAALLNCLESDRAARAVNWFPCWMIRINGSE